MLIYEELKRDHDRLREIMARIDHATSTQRADLIAEFSSELLRHVRIEEEVFYRSLLDESSLENRTLVALEEHRNTELRLVELVRAGQIVGKLNGPEWEQRFARLRGGLEAHLDWEEEELFPRAKQIVSNDEAEELADLYEEMRNETLMESRSLVPDWEGKGFWARIEQGGS